MKFRLLVILCIFFGACSQVESPETPYTPEESPQGFNASIDNEYSDIPFRWSKGDRISINGNAYYTSYHDDVLSTVFTSPNEEAVPSGSSPLYTAVYPHTIVYQDEWNGSGLFLPVNQSFTDIAGINPPMYAVSDTRDLVFRHLTGVLDLKLSLSSESLVISRISLKSSKALSGKFTISDGKAVMAGNVGSTRMVIDKKMSGNSPLSVCFNIPVGTYDDLGITVEAGNGSKVTYSASEATEIMSGKATSMEICINPEEYVPENCLYYTSSDGNIIVPFDMTPVSNVYKDGIGIMTFDSPLTTIKSNAFRNLEGYCTDASRLTDIRLPKTVKSIGNYVFENCTGLKKFRFPENELYTSIAASLFTGCSSLEHIHIPDNITKINNNAFMNCSSLKEVRLPVHLDKIPQNTFNGCSLLKRINIPESLTTIGVKAFMGTALEEFEVPAAVTELPSQTFQDCAYLKTLKLNRFGPDGSITVMSSGNVLKNCSSLEEIIVPEGSVEAYGNAENWNAYIEIIKSH